MPFVRIYKEVSSSEEFDAGFRLSQNVLDNENVVERGCKARHLLRCRSSILW